MLIVMSRLKDNYFVYLDIKPLWLIFMFGCIITPHSGFLGCLISAVAGLVGEKVLLAAGAANVLSLINLAALLVYNFRKLDWYGHYLFYFIYLFINHREKKWGFT